MMFTSKELAKAMLDTSDHAGQPSLSLEWYQYWADAIIEKLTSSPKIKDKDRPHKFVRDENQQILCPYSAGGYYCQWVKGHYGGCVMGRADKQYAECKLCHRWKEESIHNVSNSADSMEA